MISTPPKLLLTALLSTGLGFAVSTPPAMADGTEQLDTPSIPIATGTNVVGAGVGLGDVQPGTINIDIPLDATVKQVILYWAGTNYSTDNLLLERLITVQGLDVLGPFIGGNTLYSGTNGRGEVTVAYRADITHLDLVHPGSNAIFVDGLVFREDNDGAGLMVIYDDGGTESVIDIRDGNDFAFINRPVPLSVTEKQTYNFSSTNKDRFGSLVMFVASVADDTDVYGFRPSSFEVTTGGSTAVFSDQLNSNDGRYWDTVNLAVTIPAGETSLSAQVFSRDDEFRAPGNLPASLIWVASSLSIEEPDAKDCWITTGGFHNNGETSGSKDFTFGGNVGPPPRGSWEVVDHNTGDNFHSNDVQMVSCETINLTGPGQPGGKKGFKINKASFEGVGRLNHEDGYPFTGYVHDAGEPSGKKGNDKDYFSITVRDPVTNEIVFEASDELDGGNVQIHPPTGKK